jgi:hypothetical protein
MDTGKLIGRATSSTVFTVASIAAVISYGHIYSLARRNGYDLLSAGLLPLSVDGLILAASLVLLFAARAKLPTIVLARFTLWLGIAATVAANVAYGLPYGPVGAIMSAWPALSFVLTVETVMQLGKAKRLRVHHVNPPNDTSSVPTVQIASKKQAVPSVATTPAGPTIRGIMAELGCGQKVAMDIQVIMRESHVDVHKAKIIREETRINARNRPRTVE